MTTPSADGARLTVEQLADPTERFRARARSVAALIGAAAAALIVGLILAPSDSVPTAAIWWGAAAVALFIVSTSCLVIASMLRYDQIQRRIARILRAIVMPWRTSVTPDARASGQADGGAAAARDLRDRIGTWMDVGMWFAAGAVVSLVVAVLIVLTSSAESHHVRVLSSTGSPIVGCALSTASLEGTVNERDLRNAGELLRVEVEDAACAPEPLILYLARSTISIVTLEG